MSEAKLFLQLFEPSRASPAVFEERRHLQRMKKRNGNRKEGREKDEVLKHFNYV